MEMGRMQLECEFDLYRVSALLSPCRFLPKYMQITFLGRSWFRKAEQLACGRFKPNITHDEKVCRCNSTVHIMIFSIEQYAAISAWCISIDPSDVSR